MRTLGYVLAAILLTGCASTGAQTVQGLPHGPDKRPTDTARVVAGDVPGYGCIGDGQTGPRVQAIYVNGGDDRYPTVAGQIRAWAANMDVAVNDSAVEQGGTAHIRWACTNGVIDVAHVTTTTAGDDTFNAVITAVKAAGFTRTDRKYLMWNDTSDAADGWTCGVSKTYYGQPNAAPTYGKVNVGCWGYTNSVELHELGHALGAVRLDAPHTTGQGHCTDESDRLCEQGQSFTACASAHERLLDCNHDDYADWRAGSTLVGNAATSIFLVSTFGAGTPTVSPTPSTPSPTVTTATGSPSPKPCGRSNRPDCR